jgi:hypothetical protein
MQANVLQQVQQKNQYHEKEKRLYQETKKDLQKEVLKRRDELE